jgi:hypothetical protein
MILYSAMLVVLSDVRVSSREGFYTMQCLVDGAKWMPFGARVICQGWRGEMCILSVKPDVVMRYGLFSERLYLDAVMRFVF